MAIKSFGDLIRGIWSFIWGNLVLFIICFIAIMLARSFFGNSSHPLARTIMSATSFFVTGYNFVDDMFDTITLILIAVGVLYIIGELLTRGKIEGEYRGVGGREGRTFSAYELERMRKEGLI